MRADDPELLVDLYRGATADAPWREFLLRAAGRGHAAILVQSDAGVHVVSSDGTLPFSPDAVQRLRYQRVYSGDEIPGLYPVARVMRVRNAWLCLGRDSGEFPAVTASVMSSLAPHLAQAASDFLRHRAMIRDRMLADDLAARHRQGWLVLNGQAVILSANATALRYASAQIGGRLALGTQILANTLQDYEYGFHRDPVALNLDRLQVLIQPYVGPDSLLDRPVALLHLHQSLRPPATAYRILAEMVHISPSEARFALKLADGMSIAQAAESLGLTLETARNYSKMIYSKMDLRGQADLIRWIENSVIRLV